MTSGASRRRRRFIRSVQVLASSARTEWSVLMSNPARPQAPQTEAADALARSARSSSPSRPGPLRALRRRWNAHRLALSATFVLGMTLLNACNEANQEAADAVHHPPPGQLVDVGGYRMHLDCAGSGAPTVVMDAGLGDWSLLWRPVQSALASTTRVCTYDRAGMGHSDPGPLPRDVTHFVSELHTLLQRAEIAGPYVMVGHSLGGLTARVFTHRYPEEVAGVVLIESMSPQPAASAPVQPTPAAAPHSRELSFLSAAARLGLVRLLAGPLGLAQGLPPGDVGAYTARVVTPRHFQTTADEAAAIPASLTQAGEVTTLGDLPLTVLSRGLGSDPTWQAGQLRLLELSTRSAQVTAAHSRHAVELDEPQAAAAVIADMVRQVR